MSSIANVSLNHETDSFFITIKNDQKFLDRVFSGMFIVARRVLGYAGNSSSYPFSTTSIYLGFKSSKIDCEKYLKLGHLSLPTENYPHTKNKPSKGSSYTNYFVSMESSNATSNNSLFKSILSVQHDEFDKDMVDTKMLMKALFADYFDEMIEYAKSNRTWCGW